MTTITELKSCIEWCEHNGAIVDNRIDFTITNDAGVTAIAKSPIVTKESLISIPKKLLITKELAEHEFGMSSTNINSANPNALTQLYIAKMKFDQSSRPFHAPYIKILPTTLDQPYFWSSQEIELLKGTDLYLLLKQNLQKTVHEWHHLLSKLQLQPEDKTLYDEVTSSKNFDIFQYIIEYHEVHSSIPWKSFAAYLWATGIFTSRAFPKIVFDDKCSNINEAFLFPVVDFLNHKNDTPVKWVTANDKVCFISEEPLKEGDEVFNNYGNKSNEELLLNYGFAEDKNPYDCTRLTLRLDGQMINQALGSGTICDDNRVADDCVQFLITNKVPLPNNMVNFFGFLCKLKSESGVTLRNILEGQDELHSILMQKLDFFRTSSKIDPSKYKFCRSRVIQMVRKYFSSEKKLFNSSLESLQKTQKDILKKNSSLMVSFKTIYKSDKPFANSLLLTFGVSKYDDLVTKNCLKEALLLWIVRAANKDSYPRKLDYTVPQFIFDSFQEVSGSIVIERSDVAEFMDFYKKLFPGLSEKIPEVFGPGNWGIRQFIVADNVMDRLVWTRKLTEEPFFTIQMPFKI